MHKLDQADSGNELKRWWIFYNGRRKGRPAYSIGYWQGKQEEEEECYIRNLCPWLTHFNPKAVPVMFNLSVYLFHLSKINITSHQNVKTLSCRCDHRFAFYRFNKINKMIPPYWNIHIVIVLALITVTNIFSCWNRKKNIHLNSHKTWHYIILCT